MKKIVVKLSNERLITPSGLTSVREFHADPDYFKAALGISYAIPSADTLRQRMDMIGRSLRNDILKANVTIFKRSVWNPPPLKAVTYLLILMSRLSITPKPLRKACPGPIRAMMVMLP